MKSMRGRGRLRCPSPPASYALKKGAIQVGSCEERQAISRPPRMDRCWDIVMRQRAYGFQVYLRCFRDIQRSSSRKTTPPRQSPVRSSVILHASASSKNCCRRKSCSGNPKSAPPLFQPFREPGQLNLLYPHRKIRSQCLVRAPRHLLKRIRATQQHTSILVISARTLQNPFR
jgi:hypothetical protein